MLDIKSTTAGDRIFAAWFYAEYRHHAGTVDAQTEVTEGIVFSPEHGLVQFGTSTPRALYLLETPFSTLEDAWKHCAASVRAAAWGMQLAASTCDAKAVAASSEAA